MAPPHPGGEKTEPAFHHEAFGPEKQKIWRYGAALGVFFFKENKEEPHPTQKKKTVKSGKEKQKLPK